MTPTPSPTPGEIAYDVWATRMRLVGWPLPAFAEHEPSPAYQAAWEAAACAAAEKAITDLLEVQRILATAQEETPCPRDATRR